MSDYTKTTNFTVKDSLHSTILGAEFDTEFDAIQTAVASKVDENGALGTPTSGTLTNCTGLPSSGVVTGTSGATIGLLNGNNTHSGNNTFSGDNTFSSGIQKFSGTADSHVYIMADSDASSTNNAVLWLNEGTDTSAGRRWAVYKSNDTESGSNAGSSFKIDRYSDAGAGIDSVLAIDRATGVTTLKELSLTTDLAVTHGGTGASTAAAARANLGITNPVQYFTGGSNAQLVPAASTRYADFAHGYVEQTLENSLKSFRVPAAGTLSNFRFQAGSNSIGASTTITLRINGANTGLAVATSGTTAVSSSESVSVAQGDLVTLGFVASGSSGAMVGGSWSVKYTASSW